MAWMLTARILVVCWKGKASSPSLGYWEHPSYGIKGSHSSLFFFLHDTRDQESPSRYIHTIVSRCPYGRPSATGSKWIFLSFHGNCLNRARKVKQHSSLAYAKYSLLLNTWWLFEVFPRVDAYAWIYFPLQVSSFFLCWVSCYILTNNTVRLLLVDVCIIPILFLTFIYQVANEAV